MNTTTTTTTRTAIDIVAAAALRFLVYSSDAILSPRILLCVCMCVMQGFLVALFYCFLNEEVRICCSLVRFTRAQLQG